MPSILSKRSENVSNFETSEIISKVRYNSEYTTQLPKNKTPGSLDFNDMVQISNAVKLITLWKGKLKVTNKDNGTHTIILEKNANQPYHLDKKEQAHRVLAFGGFMRRSRVISFVFCTLRGMKAHNGHSKIAPMTVSTPVL